MSKCLFCNSQLKNKNKEHAIPQWILRNTGMIRKPYNLGLNYRKFYNNKNRNIYERILESRVRFNLGNYTFPSCKVCNDNFSRLESDISNVFDSLEKTNSINSQEVNILLDWFDKIRVSLWYGQTNMNGELFGINQNYGVIERMALHDRYLAIWKDKRFLGEADGFDLFGTSNIHFFNNPIYVGIRYKNTIFINISQCALFSTSSKSLEIKKRGKLDRYNILQLGYKVNDLPKVFNFSTLQYRKFIPDDAIEIVQLLDHPKWDNNNFIYKSNNEFVNIDKESLEIPSIKIPYDPTQANIKLKYKDSYKTRIHDIVKMETYLNFNLMHKEIFKQIRSYSKETRYQDLIEMGQNDLDMYILIMKKNIELYINELQL